MVEAHLNMLKSKSTKDTLGLALLILGLHERVEISININISAEIAMLMGIFWGQFDDKNIGKQTRKKLKDLYDRDIPKQWTPITLIKKQISISQKSNIHANRIQFPFRCVVAKTIYRSQGQTLEAVVADFQATNGPHKYYVAISSLRS